MWRPSRLYSRNFEDLYLWSAFKNLNSGTYIDIGSGNPLDNSVSRIFYDQGWRGVHLEPNYCLFELARKHRPNSDNFNVTVSSSEKVGVETFCQFQSSGDSLSHLKGSDSLEDAYAVEEMRERPVNVTTLKLLIDALELHSIEFVKFNSECQWFDALRGLSLENLSSLQYPKIFVFEIAQRLDSETSSRREIVNEYLVRFGYQRVYSDDSNDYYCLESQSDLVKSLSFSSNIFNEFQIECARYFNLQDEVLHANNELNRLSSRNEYLESKISRIERDNELASLQMFQIQEELKRYYDLNHQKSELLEAHADLQSRINALLLNMDL